MSPRSFWMMLILFIASRMSRGQEGWVDQLQSTEGKVCCFNYDGRRLDDPDWDTLGEVSEEFSGYRVFEDQKFHEVPKSAVVLMKNQDGIARVWWNVVTDRGILQGKTLRCFLPGGLS